MGAQDDSESGDEGGGAPQQWAPPSGPPVRPPGPPPSDPPSAPPATPGAPLRPTPRPDPYAQFGNPLHDTWGQQRRAVAQPPPIPIVQTKPTRAWPTWVRATIALVVLAAIAAAVWFGRGWIGDTYDSLSERVDGGSASGGEAAARGGTPTETPTEALQRTTEEANHVYSQWERDNRGTLNTAVESFNASALALATPTPGQPPEQAYLASVRTMQNATMDMLALLDTAPPSEIRHDFVSLFLIYVDGMNQIIAAIDGRSPGNLDAAGGRLLAADAEFERLCQVHGSSTHLC